MEVDGGVLDVAALTPLGRRVLETYKAIEGLATEAAAPSLAGLEQQR